MVCYDGLFSFLVEPVTGSISLAVLVASLAFIIYKASSARLGLTLIGSLLLFFVGLAFIISVDSSCPIILETRPPVEPPIRITEENPVAVNTTRLDFEASGRGDIKIAVYNPSNETVKHNVKIRECKNSNNRGSNFSLASNQPLKAAPKKGIRGNLFIEPIDVNVSESPFVCRIAVSGDQSQVQWYQDFVIRLRADEDEGSMLKPYLDWIAFW